jgi:hypothetical protein
VLIAASGGPARRADVDSAAALLAQALSYRHSTARHADDDEPGEMERETAFIADALELRAGRGVGAAR